MGLETSALMGLETSALMGLETPALMGPETSVQRDPTIDNRLTKYGFSVWLTCQGKVMETWEVDDEGDDDETIIAWVASEAEKPFQVHIRSTAQSRDSDVFVKIDGREIDSVYFFKGKEGDSWDLTGVRVGKTTEYPLMFSPLLVTEDESQAAGFSNETGTIKIEIYQVKTFEVKASKKERTVSFAKPKLDPGIVFEKAKKLGTHCVTLGPPLAVKPVKSGGNYMDSKPYDSDDTDPWIIFEFKYASQEFIQTRYASPPTDEGGSSSAPETPEADPINLTASAASAAPPDPAAPCTYSSTSIGHSPSPTAPALLATASATPGPYAALTAAAIPTPLVKVKQGSPPPTHAHVKQELPCASASRVKQASPASSSLLPSSVAVKRERIASAEASDDDSAEYLAFRKAKEEQRHQAKLKRIDEEHQARKAQKIKRAKKEEPQEPIRVEVIDLVSD